MKFFFKNIFISGRRAKRPSKLVENYEMKLWLAAKTVVNIAQMG
jgi:hypothetical protein